MNSQKSYCREQVGYGRLAVFFLDSTVLWLCGPDCSSYVLQQHRRKNKVKSRHPNWQPFRRNGGRHQQWQPFRKKNKEIKASKLTTLSDERSKASNLTTLPEENQGNQGIKNDNRFGGTEQPTTRSARGVAISNEVSIGGPLMTIQKSKYDGQE